jgi:hypothetical protein
VDGSKLRGWPAFKLSTQCAMGKISQASFWFSFADLQKKEIENVKLMCLLQVVIEGAANKL